MEPLLSRFIVQAAPRGSSIYRVRLPSEACQKRSPAGSRSFNTSKVLQRPREREQYNTQTAADSSYSQKASELSQKVSSEEKDHFHRVEEQSKQLQARSPWMHEGSDVPPVQRNRSAGAMTKGKLLTTPSRMLKLILPLTIRDANRDRKDVEPLALLVHPQQPLSYLERLVQSELPFMWDEKKGRERAPEVVFRAEDTMNEQVEEARAAEDAPLERGQERDETAAEGHKEQSNTVSDEGSEKSLSERSEDYKRHAKIQDDPEHMNFVRWSPSTEIGDFIRDAARSKEFAVDIEGAPVPIYVGVPSFEDRTFYLRMRLRKVSNRLSAMADVKRECDELAHHGAKQVARAGFAGLIGWWGLVYYLTFRTDLGWDVMEPVTYLVGLSGLIGGYMWFLYHNREVSYRSAMNFTVSRRQAVLYKAKGFNLPQWETLIEEGNRLRREVKLVAEEYDVDWDESKDAGDEKVREALRKERRKGEGRKEKEKEEKEGDDD